MTLLGYSTLLKRLLNNMFLFKMKYNLDKQIRSQRDVQRYPQSKINAISSMNTVSEVLISYYIFCSVSNKDTSISLVSNISTFSDVSVF